jgi:hypothetical protein
LCCTVMVFVLRLRCTVMVLRLCCTVMVLYTCQVFSKLLMATLRHWNIMRYSYSSSN